MKTKIIPVVLALVAGLITCVVSFLNGLSPRAFVKALCLVVVIFLVLGLVWEIILERAFPPPEEPPAEEESSPETGEADGETEEQVFSQEPLETAEEGEEE